jgi:hypothetical protein
MLDGQSIGKDVGRDNYGLMDVFSGFFMELLMKTTK